MSLVRNTSINGSASNPYCSLELLPLRHCLFVCVEVLQPSQPNGVMSSAFSLPNHMFTGQA